MSVPDDAKLGALACDAYGIEKEVTSASDASPEVTGTGETSSARQSESASSASDTNPNMRYFDGAWVYWDSASGCSYRWDASSNCWAQSDKDYSDCFVEKQCCSQEMSAASKGDDKNAKQELDEFEYQLQQENLEKSRLAAANDSQTASTTRTYTDPSDGTIYEWDEAKRAYFPKVNEDFLANYMASYGEHPVVIDSVPASVALKELKAKIKQERKEKRQIAAEKEKKAAWFDLDEEHNTSVYVSGLPLDISFAEFEELMTKYGVVARDLISGKLKLKLYKDESGNLKGDGLCSYLKRESVELALQILDGSTFRGKEIHVESAKFQMKGEYDPSKRRKRANAKLKRKFKERQEKLLDWRPEKLKGERPSSHATVIIKNVFTLEELKKDASLLFDYREYLTNECKKYGTVRKVVLYDNHPEGVASVTFLTPEEADDCITMMDWRYFKGRQLRAATWDGVTKYKLRENESGEKERILNWEKFIETNSGLPS